MFIKNELEDKNPHSSDLYYQRILLNVKSLRICYHVFSFLFFLKALMAQSAGYTAAIVYRKGSNDPIVMEGGKGSHLPLCNLHQSNGM